jgi:Tfp pilus assembly protein PilN
MIVSLQSSLGLQFGREYLLLAYLKKSLKEIALDCQEMIHLPPSLSGDDYADFCSREISRFMKQNAVGKENVWVGLPQNDFLLRFITLPSSAEENLREVLRYEIEKYIPFPEEDVHFDFVTLEKDAESKTLRLLLLVIEKRVLETYLSILNNAGIKPLGVEITSISLLNFFLLGKNGNEARTPVALVCLLDRSLDLNWINGGILRYSRTVDLVAEDTTGQIEQIHKEVRNSFRGAFLGREWKEDHSADSPVVFVTGGGASKEVIESLGKIRGINFQPFPADAIASRLNFSESFSQSLSSSIGLAMKGMKKVPWDVNLLPDSLRKKTSKVGLYLCCFLFLGVLLFSITWGVSTIVKDRLELRKIEKEIATLRNEVTAIQDVQQEAQKIIEQVESLEKIRNSELSKLAILKELSNILPSSVWLTDCRYHKQELRLSGYAASASDLISILDGSPLFTASEFTAPITRTREGQESFKIETSIEGG